MQQFAVLLGVKAWPELLRLQGKIDTRQYAQKKKSHSFFYKHNKNYTCLLFSVNCSMLTITAARPHQLPVIREIALATWPGTFKEILSPAQIAYMLDMMYSDASLREQALEKGHVFLLAAVDGVFGGFASYELNYKQQPVSKLHKIYILPAMQGKNVGKELIAEVVRIAKEAGMQTVSLNVNRDNKATGFYERFGFSKVGEEDIDIGNGFFMNDAIMEMRL